MPRKVNIKEVKQRIKERKAQLREYKQVVTGYISGKHDDGKAARAALSTFIKVNNAISKDVAKLEEIQ